MLDLPTVQRTKSVILHHLGSAPMKSKVPIPDNLLVRVTLVPGFISHDFHGDSRTMPHFREPPKLRRTLAALPRPIAQ